MTQAFVTPKLISWAREREHLSPDVAAEKLRVSLDKLAAWESGDARPTLRQAQALAQRLHIPFGYLFLSSPPLEKLPLPDLRTVADEQPGAPSPDFTDLLNDVLQKQEWYREYQEDEGAETIPFIGRFTVSDDAQKLAEDIRNTLGLNEESRRASVNWEDFLRSFIRRAEDVGVLVLRSGVVGNNTRRKLSVSEFRGFAISDVLAPLIFINGQDAKAAQIFTLAHELAHLWIGESGVSNPDFSQQSSHQQNGIERLCNRAAAETLLPQEEFVSHWNPDISVAANLQAIATRYRVSTVVVLRQAYDLDLLMASEYWTSYQEEIEKQRNRENRSREDGGGDFYSTLLTRNSNMLTQTLMASAIEGRVLHRDAARLLNVKVKTLDGISQRLFGENLPGG